MNAKLNNRGMVCDNHSSKHKTVIEYGPFIFTALGFFGCLVIELCGIEISREGRDWLYSVIGGSGYCISIPLNMIYGRRYGLEWRKSLLFSVLSLLLVFGFLSLMWKKLELAVYGTGTMATFRSAIFLPALCVFLSRYCEEDTLNLCDYLTPYFFFNHGYVTLGCWLVGCCAGRTWSWGLVNPLSGNTVFPTQPCIIILSIAVSLMGLRYAQKHDYKANGMVFANSLCVYGFFRYLIELFSDDARIFWAMSSFSVYSLMMLALGFLVRYISEKRYHTP